MNYKEHIRAVPNFPKEGILFYDISTLLAKPEICNKLVEDMSEIAKELKPDKIVGIEARGFIFASMLTNKLNLPFIPVRKPGKLPYKTIKHSYDLEYGSDTVEIHEDAISKGDRILIVDDLLATGGTVQATANLIEKCAGNVVGLLFAIELDDLKAKDKLKKYKIDSIIHY